MTKTLSVSIAAYNMENYLTETLDCFIGVRGVERLDVMIIDDGSKDSTAAIAKQYCELYPNVFRLIQKKNGGWGSTVTTGIQNALGKYFKLLDGDDYFVTSHIAAFLDGLDTIDSDVIITPSYAFDSDTKRRMYNIVDYPFSQSYSTFTIAKMNIWAFNPSVYGVCFKTNILQENHVTITEHCFYTDVEYVLKGLNYANTITSLPMEIYCYRKARAGQSMSLEGIKKHYHDHEKMILNLLLFETNNVTKKYIHEAFNMRLTAASANMYKWYLFLYPTVDTKSEFIKYDQLLKSKYPLIYYSNTSQIVGILRRTNYRFFKILSQYQLRQDQKHHIDIFA